MQFTTRQLLICVGGLSIWFGLMAQGHYLFGGGGVFLFGSLFGISIFFLVRLLLRWSRWSLAERGACILVVLLSMSGGIYLINNWLGHGFDHEQENVRDAQRLQAELRADSRYQAVRVTYERSPYPRGGSWLWVRGSVADQETLDSLHEKIDDDKWPVEWHVDVTRK